MAKNEKYLQLVKFYRKELKKLKDKEVVVGILANKNPQHKDSKLSVAEVGAIHEYGSPEHNIPQRSFLRSPINKRKDEILNIALKNTALNLKADIVLGKVGIHARNIVLDAFKTANDGEWKPLSPRTIEEKGSSAILIDTGQLRQSINWEIRDAD